MMVGLKDNGIRATERHKQEERNAANRVIEKSLQQQGDLNVNKAAEKTKHSRVIENKLQQEKEP